MKNKFFNLIAVIVFLAIFGFREYYLQSKISVLDETISILQERIDNTILDERQTDFVRNVSYNGFDYLAIGNSITIHGPCDYWPGEWGMAASQEEKDYYHLVKYGIENKLSCPINSLAYSYCIWETQNFDRSETWYLLDSILAPNIDLVTIQLSENCTDISTFDSDYTSLLLHIKEKCGDNVRIIVIDDFWDDYKSNILNSIVENMQDDSITFVDLSDIRNDEGFCCGIGTVILGDDGDEYVVDHNGVSTHPGDMGMQVISERILLQL